MSCYPREEFQFLDIPMISHDKHHGMEFSISHRSVQHPEAYTLLRMLDVPYTRDGKDQVLRMIHVRHSSFLPGEGEEMGGLGWWGQSWGDDWGEMPSSCEAARSHITKD